MSKGLLDNRANAESAAAALAAQEINYEVYEEEDYNVIR